MGSTHRTIPEELDNRILVGRKGDTMPHLTPPWRHYLLEDLDWIDLGETGWQKASVDLGDTDTADNPASTKKGVYGPATVTYCRAPDGGITVQVEELGEGQPNG